MPRYPHILALGLALSALLGGADRIRADETKDDAIVNSISTTGLSGIRSMEVDMLTVEYPPGGGIAFTPSRRARIRLRSRRQSRHAD